jgi:very-short-patch-repair endonuclease
LEVDGFTGFEEDRVQVVLPMGSRRPDEPWISPHWSSMLADVDVHPTRQPRRTRPARSVVDAASWQRAPHRARAIVLAGVQQQLVTTRQLRHALGRRGPCRHRALIIESILDAAGGVQSLPERDADLIRRRCGLPAPNRQAPVRRPDGRYYLDMEWSAYGVAVEIHGIPHLGVRQWEQDLERANEIVIDGQRLLVFSSYAVRHESARVGDQLVRLLRRGGWAGPA